MRPLQRHFYSLGLTDPLVLDPNPGSGSTYHFSHKEFRSGLFRDASTQGWALTWGFPDFRCLDTFRMQALHQCAGAQGDNIGPPTLGLSITGPSVYDRYRQYHCCSSYQHTGWNPFPHPVAAGSGSLSMATVSRYSHLGQTHSGLPQCAVISAEPAHHDRVVPPPRCGESNIQTVGDSSSGHDCLSPKHTPPQFMSPVPEPPALATDALSQDWQGRSMYLLPPFPLLSKVIQKLRTIQDGR